MDIKFAQHSSKKAKHPLFLFSLINLPKSIDKLKAKARAHVALCYDINSMLKKTLLYFSAGNP